MKKEDLFACLDQASAAFAQRVQEAAVEPELEQEEDDFELQMQEEELAALVAKELGLL
ncbi:MAG: hypothetical protein IKU81_04445 [Oscillibacter sp.]|jgi:hypothetical protein|nr:hypothetical protein [Oscillibacter sp.]